MSSKCSMFFHGNSLLLCVCMCVSCVANRNYLIWNKHEDKKNQYLNKTKKPRDRSILLAKWIELNHRVKLQLRHIGSFELHTAQRKLQRAVLSLCVFSVATTTVDVASTSLVSLSLSPIIIIIISLTRFLSLWGARAFFSILLVLMVLASTTARLLFFPFFCSLYLEFFCSLVLCLY